MTDDADRVRVAKFVALRMSIIDEHAASHIAGSLRLRERADHEAQPLRHKGKPLLLERVEDLGGDERKRTCLRKYALDGAVEMTPEAIAEKAESVKRQEAKQVELLAVVEERADAKLDGIRAVAKEIVVELRSVLEDTQE